MIDVTVNRTYAVTTTIPCFNGHTTMQERLQVTQLHEISGILLRITNTAPDEKDAASSPVIANTAQQRQPIAVREKVIHRPRPMYCVKICRRLFQRYSST